MEPLDDREVHRYRVRFGAWLGANVDRRNPLVDYEIVFGELVTDEPRERSVPRRGPDGAPARMRP